MSDKLPDLVDPVLLAERRCTASGAINIAALERLSELVTDKAGVAQCDVIFAKQGKRAVVSGSIKTSLMIECQSCLEEMAWPIDISFKLGVVSSLEEADKIEIDCEPLLFNGEKISLFALIEDEILLALPDYPKHGYDCIERKVSETSDYHQENDSKKTDNPFSVLAKLKNTGD
jgi:uncharacterized protein